MLVAGLFASAELAVMPLMLTASVVTGSVVGFAGFAITAVAGVVTGMTSLV
jgi:hypothetical protein